MSDLRAEMDLVIVEQMAIEDRHERLKAKLAPLFDAAKAAAVCEAFLADGVMPPLVAIAALSATLERLDEVDA